MKFAKIKSIKFNKTKIKAKILSFHSFYRLVVSFFYKSRFFFPPNQLLIFCNFKDFYSTSITPFLLLIFNTGFYYNQPFCIVVEVHLKNHVFIPIHHAFNSRDLTSWIEYIKERERPLSSFASLRVRKGECKCFERTHFIIALNFCKSQLHEFSPVFLCKLRYV